MDHGWQKGCGLGVVDEVAEVAEVAVVAVEVHTMAHAVEAGTSGPGQARQAGTASSSFPLPQQGQEHAVALAGAAAKTAAAVAVRGRRTAPGRPAAQQPSTSLATNDLRPSAALPEPAKHRRLLLRSWPRHDALMHLH